LCPFLPLRSEICDELYDMIGPLSHLLSASALRERLDPRVAFRVGKIARDLRHHFLQIETVLQQEIHIFAVVLF
jgi:hypothetical protein